MVVVVLKILCGADLHKIVSGILWKVIEIYLTIKHSWKNIVIFAGHCR